MDEKSPERIFEPFFTTQPQESGTGLGLATVGKDVTEDLEAEHSVRSGSVGESEHVLTVEDDGSVRRVLRDTLLGYGYQVTDVSNVDEAMHSLAEPLVPFDVVLTDLVLLDAWV